MRVSFVASQLGIDIDEDAVICGVSGGDEWLTFQRYPEDTSEDWGIYLEYVDQGYSGYGCVAACRLDSEVLSIDLSKQLGGLVDVTGFEVALRLRPEDWASLRYWLPLVFRGQLHLLRIA